MIEVLQVHTPLEKHRFLSFPWHLYRHDPLWVPPIFRDQEKATDPARGHFFQAGYADFFVAYREGRLAGTLCCSHEYAGDPCECSLGFFECVNDYEVAAALFRVAESWAHGHGLSVLCGTYNLDREERRGILVDGWDRPPTILCGHNPPYYAGFFKQYGFGRRHDDGLAYAFPLEEASLAVQRLYRVAKRVQSRKGFTVRHANMENVDAEIEHIMVLQNRALEHLPGFVPYDRTAVEGMVLPLKRLANPELILFAEADGQTVGWFPAIPNFNEVLIHLGGLRYPWDGLKAIRYGKMKPKCLAIKSVAVLPEYWDTGLAILLFAEMVRRASSKGYAWLDLSLTGEDNPDTWNLAHHMGAKVYKRYRFYEKEI